MKVRHCYVDPAGQTHSDEFEVPYPLDMSPGSDYFVLVNTPSNARLLTAQFRAMTNEPGAPTLMLCCPPLDTGVAWEPIRMAVRNLCLDLPHPVHGGFRLATDVDYHTARVVDQLTGAMKTSLPGSHGSTGVELRVDAATLTTISSHPVWKKCSWIFLSHPLSFAILLSKIYDPTWYIDRANPKRMRDFKKVLGLYPETRRSPLWHVVSGSLATVLHAIRHSQAHGFPNPQVQEEFYRRLLDAPDGYFVRHALRWFKHLRRTESDVEIAMGMAVDRYVYKHGMFMILAWLDSLYPEGEWMDFERFFADDTATVVAAKRAYAS